MREPYVSSPPQFIMEQLFLPPLGHLVSLLSNLIYLFWNAFLKYPHSS